MLHVAEHISKITIYTIFTRVDNAEHLWRGASMFKELYKRKSVMKGAVMTIVMMVVACVGSPELYI